MEHIYLRKRLINRDDIYMIVKKRPAFLFILVLFFCLCSCSSDNETAAIPTDWADFIKWNSKFYEKTAEIVPADLVGQNIGQILEKVPVDIPGYEPQNGVAGHLEKGTELFYIRGQDANSHICAFVHGDYILYKTRESENLVFEKEPEIQHPDIDETQAQAYYLVFQYLFERDAALNRDIKYIAVDLSDTLLENPEEFILLMEDFCVDSGYTLLLDTMDGLTEKGYIKDSHFEEGVLMHYRDTVLTTNWLETDAKKWSSGLGSFGALCSIKRTNGIWEMAPPLRFRIS